MPISNQDKLQKSEPSHLWRQRFRISTWYLARIQHPTCPWWGKLRCFRWDHRNYKLLRYEQARSLLFQLQTKHPREQQPAPRDKVPQTVLHQAHDQPKLRNGAGRVSPELRNHQRNVSGRTEERPSQPHQQDEHDGVEMWGYLLWTGSFRRWDLKYMLVLDQG